MPNGEDHDKIIAIDTKMKTICASLEKLHEKFDKQIIRSEDKCDACKGEIFSQLNEKVAWKRIGIILTIIGLLSFGGFGLNQYTVKENYTKVIELQHTVDEHVKDANKFYENTEKRLSSIENRHERIDSMDDSN